MNTQQYTAPRRGAPEEPEDGLFYDDELAGLDTAAWRRLDGPERTAMLRALFRSCAPSAPAQAATIENGSTRGAESFTTCSGSSPPTGSGNPSTPSVGVEESAPSHDPDSTAGKPQQEGAPLRPGADEGEPQSPLGREKRAALQVVAGAKEAARAADREAAEDRPSIFTPGRPAGPSNLEGVRVPVFRTKRTPGAKRLADVSDPDILERIASTDVNDGADLHEALYSRHSTDAHLATYFADDGDGNTLFARINKGPFAPQLEQAGGRLVVGVLVFDHDLPRLSSGAKQGWSADSLSAFLGDLHEAVGNSNLEPTAWYSTLHGSRFVYVLDEPVGPQEAEAMMLGIMAEFASRGIELDDSCKDWTRLFRLPNVEREGHGRYESTIQSGGPVMRAADAPRGEAAPANVVGEVDQYVGNMPDPDECRALLLGENGRGKSKLVKRAEKLLIGRESHDIIFNDRPIVALDCEEGWNNAMMRVAGQTVGMLAREECATPEGCYALLHAAVEQLQAREMRGDNATDWYDTTWGMICRAWNGEQAQIAAEREEHERRRADAHEQREGYIEEYRKLRPGEVPEGDEAHEWLMQRMIASDGRNHYIMRPDWTYSYKPVPDSLVIPKIRELGMQDLIPTTEYRGKVAANRSTRDIINDCAMPIDGIECSALKDVAHIEGDVDEKVLHIPIHRLNPKVVSRFDVRVDEWLRELGGDRAELLLEWLSHALDVRRAICALNLYGAPGTGKGMLASGLAECFRGEHLNDGRALGKWNNGLLKSPVVNCDEDVPNIGSNDDEALPLPHAFKQRVTGGKMTIRAMFTDPFTAVLFPRILFTANNPAIVEKIVGDRDLTDDDTRAIEQRLLSIEVSDAAEKLLTSRGNYSWTSGWVAGQEPSRYVIAGHIKYLYEHRQPSTHGKGRLLVEGPAGGLSPIKRKRALDDPNHARGFKAIIAAVLDADGEVEHHIATEDERPSAFLRGSEMSVTPAFFETIRNLLGTSNARGVAKALEQSGVLGPARDNGSRGGVKARWRDVDLRALLELAERSDDIEPAAVAAIKRRIGEE